MNRKKLGEVIVERLFFVAALVSVFSLLLICWFIFSKGGPAIFKIGPVDFFSGTLWDRTGGFYGILPMLVASLLATAGAIAVGVPIGLLTSIFLSFYCPKKLYRVVKPGVELLAGIPSVIYGFIGLIVLVPFISETFGGVGNSLLAVIAVLCVMILPTIVSISEASLRAVPKSYYEGSLALGENHTGAIFRVVVPAAKSGIFTAVILGIGRAIGETMAVILVAGNTVAIPSSILSSVRPMTAAIALEMSYASGLHEEALFGIGVVLFLFILLLNVVLTVIRKRGDNA